MNKPLIEPISYKPEFLKASEDWCFQSGGKDLGVFMWNRAVAMMTEKFAQTNAVASTELSAPAPVNLGEISELMDGLENAEKIAWLHANISNKNRTPEQLAEIYQSAVVLLANRITELANLAQQQEALHAQQLQSLQQELSKVSAELNRMRDMF